MQTNEIFIYTRKEPYSFFSENWLNIRDIGGLGKNHDFTFLCALMHETQALVSLKDRKLVESDSRCKFKVNKSENICAVQKRYNFQYESSSVILSCFTWVY